MSLDLYCMRRERNTNSKGTSLRPWDPLPVSPFSSDAPDSGLQAYPDPVMSFDLCILNPVFKQSEGLRQAYTAGDHSENTHLWLMGKQPTKQSSDSIKGLKSSR